MLNIDNLTLGNEFKDATGELYKVTSNFSEGKKIFVELTKQEVEPVEQLIKE